MGRFGEEMDRAAGRKERAPAQVRTAEDNEEFLLYLGMDSEVPPFANTTYL